MAQSDSAYVKGLISVLKNRDVHFWEKQGIAASAANTLC